MRNVIVAILAVFTLGILGLTGYMWMSTMAHVDDDVESVVSKAELKSLEGETGGEEIAIEIEMTDSVYFSRSLPNSSSITGEYEDYIFPNSDTQYLTDYEVAGLSEEELRLARNEIIARHGRIFESEDLIEYFNSKSWYYGYIDGETFDSNYESMLSDIEKANVELIKEYEGV